MRSQCSLFRNSLDSTGTDTLCLVFVAFLHSFPTLLILVRCNRLANGALVFLISHILVHYYDVDARLGRKCVLTNAYTQYSRPHDKTVVPVYDDYHVLFDKCDKYNRRLYHCTWPHKSGGRDVLGDCGSQHNFAMLCVLQNVLNSWFQTNNIDSQSADLQCQ